MNEEKNKSKINFYSTNCKNPQLEKSSNPNKKKMAENPVRFLSKKMGYFNVESLGKYNRKDKGKNITKEGRWSEEESDKFLEGIILYGANWKKIKALIKTRTSAQIFSHAQKYFSKMKKYKDEELGLDFTLNSIRSITDMHEQIKSINKNFDNFAILNSLKRKINKIYLNNENTNKTIYIKENINNNDSTKLSTDINYSEKFDNLLKENNPCFNLNNIINIDKELEFINKISLLNYYSNPYIDLLISNYLNSNSNIYNLLLSLLKEQNTIINTINNINNINNIKNINNINNIKNINNINNINNCQNSNN